MLSTDRIFKLCDQFVDLNLTSRDEKSVIHEGDTLMLTALVGILQRLDALTSHAERIAELLQLREDRRPG